ncbi:MAG: 3-deoxy-D-manno-octulosonate 8-phosphate phosphatase KdsC [Syntrophus sp. PtaU1.Bin208]|nr:MAG: 3-deoxy-D-manno-octulosonate 8-phosphate phosphatase KdsC [Syntrophus sp. PtaU1.Bin208]
MMESRERTVLAIIPAQGVSRGVASTSLALLAGKPLVAHAIERARQARSIHRVVVSTDDSAIAAVSRQCGAGVVRWPSGICGDTATVESALLFALDYLRRTEDYQPALLVCLQSTSPLILSEDIDGALSVLEDEEAESLLAVTPFSGFLWRRDGQGGVSGVNFDQNVRPLRRDCEPQFLETGALYAMHVQGFKAAKQMVFGKVALYGMPADRCLSIEGTTDLQIAEGLMRVQQRQLAIHALIEPMAALVLDFDGIFTDNKVIVFQDGREAVVCDRGDGWGLAQLKRLGVPILVLSTEENPVVQARCSKLGLSCLHGIRDKLTALKAWLSANRMDIAQVAYVGNDVNDLDCLRAVGCGIAVSDSHPQVLAVARIVLSAPGGRGAIRELAELIEKKWEGTNNF